MIGEMLNKAVVTVGRGLYFLKLERHRKGGEYDAPHPVPTHDTSKANLVGSAHVSGTTIDSNKHFPGLDLDFPAYLIPSSTPGHFHLYLEKELNYKQYKKLLDVMVDVGLIERGFADQLNKHGQTFLRLPTVKKEIADVFQG